MSRVETALRPRGALGELLGVASPDPYRAWRAWAEEQDVTDVELAAAERLVELAQTRDDDEAYALHVALLALFAAQRQGSVGLEVGAPIRAETLAATFEGLSLEADVERVAVGLASVLERSKGSRGVIGSASEERPLVFDRGALYLQRARKAEDDVAADLRRLLSRPTPERDVASLSKALHAILVETPLRSATGPISLAAEQVFAVARALTSSVSFITGGPGTGKTSIVTSILRAAVRLGIRPSEIALAAPTGRAANRLQETLLTNLGTLDAAGDEDQALSSELPAPRTLHRLLGYSWHSQTFKADREAPLSARLIVVDEASMIDLRLMAALLAAVPSEGESRLVLVGDADQLPAVGTGDVLRQLTTSGVGLTAAQRTLLMRALEALPEPRALLDEVEEVAEGSLAAATARLRVRFRQASDEGGQQIVALAERISRGEGPSTKEPEGVARVTGAADLLFNGVELLEGDDERMARVEVLERWHEAHLRWAGFEEPLREGFRHNDEALVRFMTRALASRVLCFTHKGPAGEEAVNRQLATLSAPGSRLVPYAFAGAPVLVLANDGAVGLYNGDQGVVVPIAVDGEVALQAAFPAGSGVRLVPLSSLPRAALAYAMTVHKSQGSEYEHVLLMLPPDENHRLLRRETLYTAVTRAKRSVTIVGRSNVLERGVERRDERFSRLRERIVDAPSSLREG